MYLLINIADLSLIKTPIGSPIHMMVKRELGDDLWGGSYVMGQNIDDVGICIESSEARCAAIRDGLNVLAKRKIGRSARTAIRKTPPKQL